MGRFGEIWGDMGRYREIWGDVGRCGEHGPAQPEHLVRVRIGTRVAVSVGVRFGV